jgi:hypothetical protein
LLDGVENLFEALNAVLKFINSKDIQRHKKLSFQPLKKYPK